MTTYAAKYIDFGPSDHYAIETFKRRSAEKCVKAPFTAQEMADFDAVLESYWAWQARLAATVGD